MTKTDRGGVFGGERGVSPVIGVILMVAITVTLAAVVGTFVLGLSDQVAQTAPQATVAVEGTDVANDQITFEHRGGATLNAADFRLVVESGSDSFTLTSSGSASLSTAESFTVDTDATSVTAGWGESDWSGSGDSIDLGAVGEVTVTFVHEPSGQIVAERTVRV